MECYRSGGRQGSCFLADRSEGGFSLAGLIGRATSSWRYDGTSSARFSPRRSQGPDRILTVLVRSPPCVTRRLVPPLKCRPCAIQGWLGLNRPASCGARPVPPRPTWSLGVRGCETRGTGGTCGSCCAPDGVVFRCEM